MNNILSKPLLAALGLTLLGFFLRVYQIDSSPPSLNWDEVSHGYNAYSILTSGKDEWGVAWPVIFRAYGDYKLPVYIYLTAVSEFFFGLSAFSIRLTSIVAGTLTVLFSYFLVSKSVNPRAALFVALLVAVSPWTLFLSRAALEANLALFFVVSGVYLFLVGLERKNYLIPLSIIFFGLSVWTYNSARIFAPLILAALGFVYRKDLLDLRKQKINLLVTSCVLVVLFFVPMFIQLLNSQGQARYVNVRILDEGANARINELRNNADMRPLIERAVYNKATYFAHTFLSNYVKHFSPNFLFFKGSDNYQFNIPGFGLVYAINLPFFIIGLFEAWKSRKVKFQKVLLAWLILSPVAASLTRESPHTLRSIVMSVPVLVLIAQGIGVAQARLKNKAWTVLYLSVLLISFGDYYNHYLTTYRQNYSWSWQYGYKEAVTRIQEDYDKYEKFVVTKKYGEPHEFLLFYTKWEPESYRTDPGLTRYGQSNWYWVDKFDKFYFVNDWEIPSIGSEFTLESGETFSCASCLLVTSPGKAPEGWKKLETIYFLDGKEAFEIYEH